jgi:8-oxo-dGTP pyrophosphatase MutT (NUDIX family)
MMQGYSMHKWHIRSARVVFEALPFFRVQQEECQLPDGRIIPDYYVIEEKDVVMVFGITPTREILLVEQYKHGRREICLELPAGYSEGADMQAEARREFLEETGHDAAQYIALPPFVNNPTRGNNRLFAFIALDAYPVGEQRLDPNECIRVHHLPIGDVINAIADGRINVTGSVATIFCALHYLNQRS